MHTFTISPAPFISLQQLTVALAKTAIFKMSNTVLLPFSDLYFSSWTPLEQPHAISYPKKTPLYIMREEHI